MKNLITALKRLLPDREMDLRILRGPFRGGVFYSRPRSSLRKVFGLYEHELNGWVASVLPRVDQILDVGANDGYFTFGCAAAMRRLGKSPRVIAFEPNPFHVRQLEHARQWAQFAEASVRIIQSEVGRDAGPQVVTLDQFWFTSGTKAKTLIKIDVEGAELDVIAGGLSWLKPENFFLIEVHREDALSKIADIFQDAGLCLAQVDQRPLPVLGREVRHPGNWWLVTAPVDRR